EGRKMFAEVVQKVAEEGSKFAFEPDSAAEIASLTKEIKEDVANGNIGIIDSFNYLTRNENDFIKLYGQLFMASTYRMLKGKVTKAGENPILVDEEGAEAVRTIMFALSNGKLDTKEAAEKLKPIMETGDKLNSGSKQFETNKMKENITKEDMEKMVKALKEYVKKNNLEKPSEEVTADSLAKEEVIKFLKGIKKLKK
ncbi:MAG: hypothetical protein II567_10750, partial [Candidatus Riflebacteria bacterium]|nr:hypothetical protein [Candidatus Riflebacteria bacterium]